MVLRLLAPRKRGLIAETTTKSATMRAGDDDLLAVGRDEPRERASAGRGRRRSSNVMRPPPHGSRRPSRRRPTRAWPRSRSMLATSRPPCITSTRSLMPSTSGSSLEIIRIAMPCCASRPISAWISDLAPTSMPRVGSSMIRMRGSVSSHLPSTTFCWLPPDSWPTTCSGPAGADAELLDRRRRPRRLGREVDEDAAGDASRAQPSRCSRAMVIGRTSPCRPRSSGT